MGLGWIISPLPNPKFPFHWSGFSGFWCQENGQSDGFYMKWRWQPFGSNLPRGIIFQNHLRLAYELFHKDYSPIDLEITSREKNWIRFDFFLQGPTILQQNWFGCRTFDHFLFLGSFEVNYHDPFATFYLSRKPIHWKYPVSNLKFSLIFLIKTFWLETKRVLVDACGHFEN